MILDKKLKNNFTATLQNFAVALIFFVIFAAMPAIAAIPGAPIIGPASAGSNQVTINFSPPASDGGSPITGYTVTSIPGGLTASGATSPITVNGLTNGTAYTFSITATNNSGPGTAAVTQYYTTPRLYAPRTGTINNLVVFIRFNDQPEFSLPLSYYDGQFNTAPNSLKNFYLENSYNALTVNSTFYPTSSGTVTSYQDSHPTAYYLPYNAVSNPIGYQGAESTTRETALISNALNTISAQITGGLDLDIDSDGYIDHITFEVYSTNANPLPGIFFSRATYDTSKSIIINGKNVGSYTWVTASQDILPQYPGATEIHEMGHSFGYPDLRGNTGRIPVGDWDVMSQSKPVHSGAYLKNRFTGWIANIPEIDPAVTGNYSLNSLTQSSNNSFKIKIPNNNEFLILEYRKSTAPFESNLPGSGLCITRVNEAAGIWGNLGGPPFFLYYFRPGGTFASDGGTNSFSCLNAESGRVQLTDNSTPACFLSNGSPCGICIDNIGTTSGSSINFSICNPATTITKRVISGYLVNGGNRVSGATVTLAGDASGTATTDSLGRYVFTVNDGGNYAVTPAKANLSFSPASPTFNNLVSDQVQNFTATNNTIIISGTVRSAGTPLSGVSVSCTGGNYPAPVTTDASGAYSFTVYAGYDYVVSVAKSNYFFTNKSFTNLTSDQVQDFANWTATVNLTGTITYNGNPLSGATVDCPGANTSNPITTDGNGTYSFNVTVGNGSVYTVTPSSSTYTFSPLNKFYTGLISNQVQNFTATPQPTVYYTVSLNSNSGSAVTSQSIASNSIATAPTAPTRTGYTFAGWYSDVALTAPFAFSTIITADITLYAKWAINSYTVSFNSNSGSVINDQTVNYNRTATAPTPPTRTGYTFAGWYSDVVLTAPFAFSTVITADITLYAKWAINSYIVSFNSNSGSTVNSQTVTYNNTATAPTGPTRTGYTFASWYSDIALTTPFVFNTAITADITLYAKWIVTPVTYSVSPTTDIGGSISPSTTQTINNAATTIFTVTPVSGYGILSVTGCNGTLNGNTYTTGVISADCTVSVTSVARNASSSGTSQSPTITDALKVFQSVVGTTVLSAADRIRYDVAPLAANGTPLGNGKVDAADVVLVLRRIVGIGGW